MNKELLKQELRNLMEAINEQQQQVLSHQGKIPQIEMDILMGNIRTVYERLTELNKTEELHHPISIPVQYPVESIHPEELIAAATIPVFEEKEIVPEVTEPVSAFEEVTESLNAIATNVVAHVQPEVIVAMVETPVVEVKNEIITEAVLPQAAIAKERAREFSKPSAKISATASLFDDAPTIAGQFQGAPTVREKIAGTQEDKSIAEKLQHHPVSDLKKSIGINEKFAFINELFDGDLDGYNSAIEQLNNAGNIQEATGILNNQLSEKYNWSNDGLSFMQLKHLIERRFTA